MHLAQYVLPRDARSLAHAVEQALPIVQIQRGIEFLSSAGLQGTHRHISSLHYEYPVPRDDGSYPVSYAQKRLVCKLAADCLLDFCIGFEVYQRCLT